VVSFPISNATVNTAAEQTTPDSIAFPGSSPYISANGTQNGIVWVIDKGTGQLRAYDASNLANELWTSNHDALPGGSVKFSVATPVNGRVYALSATSLVAYGPPVPPTAPPAAPTVLKAAATGASTVNLTWTDNSNNEAGFSIERSTDGVNFTQVNTVGVNVTSYTDSNLTPESKYYYQVRAYNSYNTLSYSAYTNIASATTLSVGQQAPVDLYHFDAGTGTTALDSAGTNTGTLVGTTLPTWVAPGRVGAAALSFSGTGTYNQTNQSAVQLSSDLSPILGSTSSIDAWIKTTQVGNNTHWQAPAITGVEQASGGNDINWGTLNAAGDIGIYVGDAGGVYSTSPVNDGQWHNVAMTRNATTGVVQLYVDGVSQGTGTYDTGNKTSQIKFIGALGDVASDGVTPTGANYFNGQIDEVRIYNQVLDPQEINALSLPPAAPTSLTVTPASGTELDLAWTDNSTYATGYIVQRSVNNGPWVSLPTLPSGTNSYNDTGLSPNTLYSYQVQAIDTAGASAFSNVASTTTPIPPTTPTGGTATFNSATEIDLKWTNTSTNATGIRILRSVIGGEFVAITNNLSPAATTYPDTGLTPGTEYDYHIQAYNVAGFSDFAGVHTGTIAASPGSPAATAGDAQTTLTWVPPMYNGDAQNLTYNVYRGTTPGGEAAAPVATGIDSPTFTDTALADGQTYYYTITSVDLGGESPFSAEVSVTPLSLTVNDGSAQRSEVTSLTVKFTAPVTLQSGAITLSQRPAGTGPTVPVPVNVANPSGDGMTYLVTFTGATGPALDFGSLPDGVYDLTVQASLVAPASGGSAPPLAADAVFTFHRLFGDFDGNQTVSALDYSQFKNAFGSSTGSAGYSAAFDFDGNGTINAFDYAQFKKRFGVTYSY
jgi:titin